MKGFHHPKGSQQAFLRGLAHLYNLIPYQPTNGARSMPANVEWKSKEEQSQHATASSTCKSSCREAFDER